MKMTHSSCRNHWWSYESSSASYRNSPLLDPGFSPLRLEQEMKNPGSRLRYTFMGTSWLPSISLVNRSKKRKWKVVSRLVPNDRLLEIGTIENKNRGWFQFPIVHSSPCLTESQTVARHGEEIMVHACKRLTVPKFLSLSCQRLHDMDHECHASLRLVHQ